MEIGECYFYINDALHTLEQRLAVTGTIVSLT